MKTLKLILVLWFFIGVQQAFGQGSKILLAQSEIHKDTVIFGDDNKYLNIMGNRLKENIDVLWGRTYEFHKYNSIHLKKIPKDNSFALGFWISIPDKREGIHTSIIRHSNKSNPNDWVELYVDGENYIHFNKSKNGLEPGTKTKSKEPLESKIWYYITYEYNSKSVKFSLSGMTSKRYRFNAFYPFRTENCLFSLFNNPNPKGHSIIYGNAFKLYDYSGHADFVSQKLNEEFSKDIQAELFKYYKSLKAGPSFKERRLEEVDSVRINTREFTLKLWDSQDVDGDEIYVYSKDGFLFLETANKYKIEGRSIEMLEKARPQTITIKFPNDTINQAVLIFAADKMGKIRDFNTIEMKVLNADKEIWQEGIEFNPTLNSNKGIRFIYDPNAQPPDQKTKTNEKLLDEELDGESSKTQKITLRVSDYSLKDGDVLKIKVNDQPEITRKLKKKKQAEDIVVTLDKKDNVITFSSDRTRLFKCTANVDILEMEGRSPSRRVSSEKMSISKKTTFTKKIKFKPRQYKEHKLVIPDNELTISVSDFQKIDGDSLKVIKEGTRELLLENSELTNRPLKFKVAVSPGAEERIRFIPTSKGTNARAANLCRVTVTALRGGKEITIVEYVMQMPKINDPGVLILKRK